MSTVVTKLIQFVPIFWGRLTDWIWLIMLKPFRGSIGLTAAALIVALIVYLILCRLAGKLLDRIIGGINDHMMEHNFYVSYNFRLYFIALLFMALEAFDVFAAGGTATGALSRSGRIYISFFALVAGGIMLLALIRMLFRAKWRIVYFFPLQMFVWALLYLNLLVLLPAALMAGAGVAAGSSGKKERCRSCKKSRIECTCGVGFQE